MRNKNTKLARDEASTTNRLQSCLEKCIAGVASKNNAGEEKFDARWAIMFEKQEVKIRLLKTNVTTKKRKDLVLLTTDMSSMGTEVKE
jgi:hypothetical protein